MLNWFRRAGRRPCQRRDAPALPSNAPGADSPPGCAIAERTARIHILYQKDAGADSSGTALIPDGTEEIARRAFSGMDQLRRVVLPHSVKKLGSHAFAGCRNLEEVILNDGLEMIEENAFSGCTRLRCLTIPDSLRETMAPMFLQTAFVSPVYNRSGTVLYHCPSVPFFSVPCGVRRLAPGAFWKTTAPREVILPEGLEEIDPLAFQGARLCGITLPASIRAVGRRAFTNCRELETVNILCDPSAMAQGAFALCPRLRLLHRGAPVSFFEELRLRGIHVLDARGGADAPTGGPWEVAGFQALAARCAQGDGAAMWAFAEHLEALVPAEFFHRAANFWRYQAARRGDECAAAWLQRWFAEHPRQRIPSVLHEDLSPGASGRALRAMGFLFFDPERSYTLDGLDDNGILRARSWCGGEGPDEDGYGREELYDWWLLDGLLRPIPGVPMLCACSTREIRSSEQYTAAYAAAVRAVRYGP